MALKFRGNTGFDKDNAALGPEFYSTFPSLGKNLSAQWDELRHDLRTLGAVVRSTVLHEDTTKNLQDAALAAIELGESGFHNRFRFYWSDTTSTLAMQRNTNTEASPLWSNDAVWSSGSVDIKGKVLSGLGAPVSDRDAIRNIDLQNFYGNQGPQGEVGVAGPEGGEGSFYGVTVKETSFGVSFSGIRALTFDSTFFYIVQNSPNTDEVVVSLR